MQQTIERELELMSSFAAAYRPKFDAMIRQANGGQLDSSQSLRLCVEAMSLILDSQSRLARALTADRPLAQAA